MDGEVTVGFVWSLCFVFFIQGLNIFKDVFLMSLLVLLGLFGWWKLFFWFYGDFQTMVLRCFKSKWLEWWFPDGVALRGGGCLLRCPKRGSTLDH